MTRDNAYDDAVHDEPELRAVGDALAALPAPQPVNPELKKNILAAVANTPQDNVVSIASRRRRTPQFLYLAAAIVALAGVALGGTQLLNNLGREPETVISADAGTQEMHAIMAADDVRSADMDANGATLAIVVSDSMGKGGAMVDGAPSVDDGMGAQVWAVSANGDMHSAGVIGPEPHDDVWMPLPAHTQKIVVTMEPMVGSAQPTGPVLAESPL